MSEVIRGYGLRHELSAWMNAHMAGSLHVVSDLRTLAACGWQADTLPFAAVRHTCFETSPKAILAQAKALMDAVRGTDYILAIGSGTINDLCKYAAHQLGIPYVVMATAPSMNGYVSPNASLESGGYKQSFAARVPLAVLADYEILANAPRRLIQSGLGDTLCRSTIDTDIHVSHVVSGTPDYAAARKTLYHAEQHLLKHLSGDYIQPLFDCLIVSGEAMAQAGNSAPASQGEHMIAHMLEMLDPDLSARHYHGEIIAVTTLSMARIQEACQRQPIIQARFPDDEIAMLCDKSLASHWRDAYMSKWTAVDESSILPKLPSTRLNAGALCEIFDKAGCPTHPRHIGIDDTTYRRAVALAAFSRDRLTMLDIAAGVDMVDSYE